MIGSAVTDDKDSTVKMAFIVDANRFVGIEGDLPAARSIQRYEKADHFEHRLSRLESTVGLSVICDR
ncbi:hypothetical protein [Pseudomonas viridiflava]|uniref:hypothetical protein n=1 Tax=Pseudomonas viridiflava TaxID=33069 RepID=UPI002B1D717E|nr:hypothetical protein [Pseudomonas viridiflava]